jgi:hypothetical protein
MSTTSIRGVTLCYGGYGCTHYNCKFLHPHYGVECWYVTNNERCTRQFCDGHPVTKEKTVQRSTKQPVRISMPITVPVSVPVFAPVFAPVPAALSYDEINIDKEIEAMREKVAELEAKEMAKKMREKVAELAALTARVEQLQLQK